MKHIDPSDLEYVFKDAGDDDPVAKAINDLAAEFAAFKTKQNGKFDAIEKEQIAELNRRLDELVAKAQRPGAVAETSEEQLEAETKAFNHYLRDGFAALDDAERKTLNWGTPSAGGYVTAPTYATTIIEKLTQFSPMRPISSVMSIGGLKVYLPVLTTKITAGWVTETGSRGTTEPAFDQLPIEAFEMAAVVPVSRQLLEDSFIDLSGFLAGQIGEQFGKLEATAFVHGVGTTQPTGFMKTPSDYAQVSADDDGSDIVAKAIELFYKLPAAYASRGTWLMNRTTQGVLRAAADNATKGLLWSDGLANGTPANFMGRPVMDAVDMDNMQSGDSPAADTFPIAFGDFASAYQIVDRTGLTIQRDDFTGADNGIVKFRAHRRVGGAPKNAEAIVLMKAVAD
jgi:HK97 family phage major capsid protein